MPCHAQPSPAQPSPMPQIPCTMPTIAIVNNIANSRLIFGYGVANGSLGLSCGRLQYVLSSAARRPPPSASSEVGNCLLCVPCKPGSEPFWPAKTLPLSSCSSIRSSSFCVPGAAHMSVMHIPSPCCAQSCYPGFHVDALITMLSPLRT